MCTIVNRMDNMQWTPYMDEYLHGLVERPDWEGDKILSIQIRCHLITSQILRTPWAAGLGTDNDMLKYHVPYFTKALQAQLQEIKRTLPPELEKNG